MKAQWLLTRLIAATLYFPTFVVAVTLDPGPVGNLFFLSAAGSVNTLG